MGSWRLLTAAGQPTASGAAGPTGQLVRWMATVGASYSLRKMTGVETVAFAVAMIMAKSSLAAFCSMTAACSMIVTRSTTSVCSVAVARSVTVAYDSRNFLYSFHYMMYSNLPDGSRNFLCSFRGS